MSKLAFFSPQIDTVLLLDILYTKSECVYVHVCASTYVYSVVTWDWQKLFLVFSMVNFIYFVKF